MVETSFWGIMVEWNRVWNGCSAAERANAPLNVCLNILAPSVVYPTALSLCLGNNLKQEMLPWSF